MTLNRAVYRIGLGIWIGAILVALYSICRTGTESFETTIAYQVTVLIEGFIGAVIFVIADGRRTR